MRTSPINSLIEHLRRAVPLPDCAAFGDAVLLGRFIESHDEAAFAVLVIRHGPMVWGVCRRLLNQHDAEDAFQATFLVLARKAASIRSKQMVGNWLHGVAHQTAMVRRTAARRSAREVQVTTMPDIDAVAPDPWADIQPLLDEELRRLPDICRAVIVLCDLEGRTRREVASHLGVPEGTVAARVARARAMLAKRLTHRGVALSGGALAAVLAHQAASAGVPNSVVVSTIKAASLFAAGKAATGAISGKVAALTEGVMKAMLFTKLKSAIAVVLILGFVACGATILSSRTAAGQEEKQPAAQKPPKWETDDKQHASEKKEKDKAKALKDEEAIQGTWQVVTMEAGGDRVSEESVRSINLKYRIVIRGNKMLTMPTEATPPEVLKALPLPDGAFVLNEKASPKQIDWTFDGKKEIGIYALEDGKMKLCFDPNGKDRPTAFKTKKQTDQYYCVLQKQENEKEKEGFTAWGKEVGALQAGLGYRPGEHRAYHLGETVTLVIRVRNVGKETVKFTHIQPCIERTILVTDGNGKAIPQPVVIPGDLGYVRKVAELSPGKEIDLYELKRRIRPASEGGSKLVDKQPPYALYATGKVQVQYDKLVPKPTDEILGNIGTGKLELEVKDTEKLPQTGLRKPKVEKQP